MGPMIPKEMKYNLQIKPVYCLTNVASHEKTTFRIIKCLEWPKNSEEEVQSGGLRPSQLGKKIHGKHVVVTNTVMDLDLIV